MKLKVFFLSLLTSQWLSDEGHCKALVQSQATCLTGFLDKLEGHFVRTAGDAHVSFSCQPRMICQDSVI